MNELETLEATVKSSFNAYVDALAAYVDSLEGNHIPPTSPDSKAHEYIAGLFRNKINFKNTSYPSTVYADFTSLDKETRVDQIKFE